MNAPHRSKPITTTRFGYPFKNKQEQEITDPHAFYAGLASVQTGHYLLTSHRFFHGGIHIDRASAGAFSLDDGIRCMADGEVVAYRINRRYHDATPGTAGDGLLLRPYSTGFVLVRHTVQAPSPPQPPKPAPMEDPLADPRNLGTYLYADREGRQPLIWLAHGTPLTVEIEKFKPGESSYVRVLAGLPREGWINRTWLALDPLAGTSLGNFFGFKERIATSVYRGDRADPAKVEAYAQNEKARERPAPPPAPSLMLYSLYMHVADFESYGKHPKWPRPPWWPVKRYRVGKKAKDRKAGVRERSGRRWVERFPTSRAIGDLTPSFAASVNRFVQALQAAGASARVSATYRPTERAYLMHYAWRIARERLAPSAVPVMEGVDIDWAHVDANGVSDAAAALQAARDMVAGYNIVYRPSLTSRHTERRAIDMTISGAIGRSIRNASGRESTINSSADLHEIGRSYGVVKLLSDPPHWSDDGH